MMLSLHHQCQWIKCSAVPTRHVTFSVRVFDAADAADADRIHPDQRDLCEKHTEHVLRHYLHVTISDLDMAHRMPSTRLTGHRRHH